MWRGAASLLEKGLALLATHSMVQWNTPQNGAHNSEAGTKQHLLGEEAEVTEVSLVDVWMCRQCRGPPIN